MSDAKVFDALCLGIKFDRKKYSKDIEIFEKSVEHTRKIGACWCHCVSLLLAKRWLDFVV